MFIERKLAGPPPEYPKKGCDCREYEPYIHNTIHEIGCSKSKECCWEIQKMDRNSAVGGTEIYCSGIKLSTRYKYSKECRAWSKLAYNQIPKSPTLGLRLKKLGKAIRNIIHAIMTSPTMGIG